jgi:hypothetical protein
MSTQFLLLRLAGALAVAAVGGTADMIGLRAPILLLVAGGFVVWLATFVQRDRIDAAFRKDGKGLSERIT